MENRPLLSRDQLVSERTFPIRILLERHGEFHRIQPNGIHSDDEELAGWLTSYGKEQTRKIAQEKAEEILTEGVPVTFFFLNSPSVWHKGKRAEQTAWITFAEVSKLLYAKNLPEKQAAIHLFGNYTRELHATPALAEPNLYHVKKSVNPAAYHAALKKKYRHEWEEGFHVMDPELEEVRTMVGAESSADVATSTLRLFKGIERYSNQHKDTYRGRELVFWVVTHGDRIRSTLQYGLGLGEKAKGITINENEIVDLRYNKENISGTFREIVINKNI